MIIDKQKQVIFCDLLFDVSYFYVKSLNLFTLDSYKIQMKELLLIKDRYIVKVNDKALHIYNYMDETNFDLKIKGFYASSWSTYNIYIIGNHLFFGIDIINEYYIVDLNAKDKIKTTKLSDFFDFSEPFNEIYYNKLSKYIYIRYFENNNLLIGREQGALGDFKGFLFYNNESSLNFWRKRICFKEKYLYVSENGRYILVLLKSNHLILLDCMKKMSSTVNSLKMKNFIMISETDECILAMNNLKQLSHIISFKIRDFKWKYGYDSLVRFSK